LAAESKDLFIALIYTIDVERQEKICPGRFHLILTWREVDKLPKAVPAGLLHSCHPSAAESLPFGQLPVAVTTESLLLGRLPNTETAEVLLLG
jgi:hypothetical protein